MPTYAVKIGEIHLTSDEPITAEQRKEVIRRAVEDFKTLSWLQDAGLLKFVPEKVG
jgi:hypothetical protein